MAGVKGKSGRKANIVEVDIKRLMDKSVRWLLENFDDFEMETKLRVALEISKKIVPQKHEHTGEVTVSLKQMVEDVSNYRRQITDIQCVAAEPSN